VLKNKYLVLKVFKDFHAKVQSETTRKMKYMRANNGGEE
jgi:hypothetical protein